MINNEVVGKVVNFEYLGSHIDSNSDCLKEIKRRLAMAAKKFLEMERLWTSSDNALKLRVLRAVVLPSRVVWLRVLDIF